MGWASRKKRSAAHCPPPRGMGRSTGRAGADDTFSTPRQRYEESCSPQKQNPQILAPPLRELTDFGDNALERPQFWNTRFTKACTEHIFVHQSGLLPPHRGVRRSPRQEHPLVSFRDIKGCLWPPSQEGDQRDCGVKPSSQRDGGRSCWQWAQQGRLRRACRTPRQGSWRRRTSGWHRHRGRRCRGAPRGWWRRS